MKVLISLAGAAVVASTLVSALPPGPPGPPGPPSPGSSISSFNPYADHQQTVSSLYRTQTLEAARTLASEGKLDLAAKAKVVSTIPTFYWLDSFESIKSLRGWLKEALETQRSTKKKQIISIVVYNLPNRDCSAAASAGELTVTNGGEEKYKVFIETIAKELRRFPELRIALQLETDAIGNLVTNTAAPKCAEAVDVQKRSLGYGIAKLQLPNVAIYLDGAHAAWLGWESNLPGTASVLTEVVELAKTINPASKVRGITTNVSNYNGLGNQAQVGYDELVYIRNLAPLLSFDAHFLVDQGRSGVQNVTRSGGDWCNNKFAGFGPRPSTNTPDALVDAIVWIKPGGQADGTSDPTAVRFDEACGSETSLKPAPEAGAWFQAYFEQLLRNANPAL